jgi:hypothetical protein
MSRRQCRQSGDDLVVAHCSRRPKREDDLTAAHCSQQRKRGDDLAVAHCSRRWKRGHLATDESNRCGKCTVAAIIGLTVDRLAINDILSHWHRSGALALYHLKERDSQSNNNSS